MDNKLDSYRTADTMGKSQIELILQVYDGAIKAFTKAREHYEQEQNNEGHEELEKARKFLTHLYTTLDTDRGGDVAENLGKLYALIISQTDIVQATKDLKMIDTNLTLLGNLREGWAGIGELQKTELVPSEAQTETVNTAM